jgi:REP element-mobilizing transposase RayT
MSIFIDHHRRSIRMPGFDYSAPNIFFITICTIDREPLFGEIELGKMILSEYGEIVKRTWDEIPTHYSNVDLDEFIVMPDHVHGIIRIVDELYIYRRNDWGMIICRGTACRAPTNNDHTDVPLNACHQSQFEQFSQPTTNSIPTIIRSFKSAVTNRIHSIQQFPRSVWQRNYFERVIHSEDELFATRTYIRDNPKKWNWDHGNRCDP